MLRKMFVSAASVALLSVAANAAVITSYNLNGTTGSQTTQAPTSSATNVTGLSITRGAGLSASAAGDSFNSTGFTQQATDFVSFGFTVASGSNVNLTNLQIGTRSSGTGPKSVGLYYSGDNFATPLTTLAQPNATFLYSTVDLSSLSNLTGTVEFQLRQIGTTGANGNASQSGGTFRVANFSDTSTTPATSVPITFNGTVNTPPTGIPEPSSLALIGLAGLALRRRRRS